MAVQRRGHGASASGPGSEPVLGARGRPGRARLLGHEAGRGARGRAGGAARRVQGLALASSDPPGARAGKGRRESRGEEKERERRGRRWRREGGATAARVRGARLLAGPWWAD